MLFLDLGLGSAVTREVAGARHDRQPFLHSAGRLFVLFGAAGALLLTAVGTIAHAAGFGDGTPGTPAVFALIGLAFLGDQLTLYHVGVLGGMRRFGTANGLLAASAVARALGIVALADAGASVVTIAGWYAASAFLWAAANIVVLRRMSPQYALRVGFLDRDALRARLGFGMHSLLIMGAMGAMWSAGALVVAIVDGPGASALFQVSQRFPLALSVLPERVAATLFPAAGQPGITPAAAWSLEVRGRRLILLAIAAPVLVLLVAPAAVLEAWLDDVPPHGAAIMRLSTLAVVASAAVASTIQVSWGRGATRPVALALGTGAVVTVASAALLTVAVGVTGAAAGLLAGWTVTAILLLSANRAALGP
jgi:O-antigen/teichoic acid export membrane protein